MDIILILLILLTNKLSCIQGEAIKGKVALSRM